MSDNKGRIFAICGSLRKHSANSAILELMGSMCSHNIQFSIYRNIGLLPHFNPELEGDKVPSAITNWRLELKNAAAVLICTPEYAFGVPGTLKNALDWTVYTGDFNNKPVGIITASTGGERAHSALRLIFTALGARIIEEAGLLIPFVGTKVNEMGEITDPAIVKSLQNALKALEIECTTQTN